MIKENPIICFYQSGISTTCMDDIIEFSCPRFRFDWFILRDCSSFCGEMGFFFLSFFFLTFNKTAHKKKQNFGDQWYNVFCTDCGLMYY